MSKLNSIVSSSSPLLSKRCLSCVPRGVCRVYQEVSVVCTKRCLSCVPRGVCRVYQEVSVVCTFVYMSEDVEFWSNATLNGWQKIITASTYTKEVEVAVSCKHLLNQVSKYVRKRIRSVYFCQFLQKSENNILKSCYSSAYSSETQKQQRFIISEVAADWYCSTLCSDALCKITDNWTHSAASRHTTTPISNTKPSVRCHSRWATTHFPSCWGEEAKLAWTDSKIPVTSLW